MPARTDASPMDERFGIETVIRGLAQDIIDLRAGKISVEDARVRADLAKQLFNGVRIVVSAQKFLAENARLVEIQSREGPKT